MKIEDIEFNEWLSYQDMIERIKDQSTDIELLELEEELHRDNIKLVW
jgi:hypothetical protein